MKKIVVFLYFVIGLHNSLHSHDVTLVWQINRAIFWEGDWVTEILNETPITKIIDDEKYETFVDNAIVVVSADARENSKYFQKLHIMNYKYGIIVVGDERYRGSTDFYPHAQFVFRNYWHKKFVSQKNVHFFPLGYKTGFWKHCARNLKNAQNRDYVWSFAGQITKKPTRKAMITVMQRIPKNYVHETFTFGDANSLSVDRYQNMLLDTIFAPCPTGWWNLDSFRVYEALECGCIPIVERKPLDYFGLYFGKHPFLVVDSWDQAPGLINALLSDPAQVEAYRTSCHRWWLDYKDKVKKEVSSVVKNSFAIQP